LEKSVDYYRDALNIKYDEETKKNMEFVLGKIKEEKKKEQEKKQEKDKKQEKKDSDNKNKQSEEKK